MIFFLKKKSCMFDWSQSAKAGLTIQLISLLWILESPPSSSYYAVPIISVPPKPPHPRPLLKSSNWLKPDG